MTLWQWWAGFYDEVQEDGSYSLGEFNTREEAIAAGLRDTVRGQRFHIIEARSSQSMKYEGADIVPFLRKRNAEVLVNGPQAQ